MAPDALSAGLLAWIAFAVVLAGLIHGALGFGFPFVATPLVALGSDIRTAVFVVLVPTLAAVLVNIAASGPLRPVLARFWAMPLYAIAGSYLGTTLFVAAPGFPYALLLAAITLLYLNLDRLGLGERPWVRRHERALAPLSGVCAGFFEGTANVAAPPLIIFYLALGLEPAAMVQALNICFLVGKAIQLGVLTAQAGIAPSDWLATLPFALAAVAGFFLGLRARARIDAHAYRMWVKRALLAIALFLIAQSAYRALAGA